MELNISPVCKPGVSGVSSFDYWFIKKLTHRSSSTHDYQIRCVLFCTMDKKADVAIIGGGIIGLAHAYIALRKGLRVVLFEREPSAQGASLRNFGLVWPVGQETGPALEMALLSRHHWLMVSKEAGFTLTQNGSLHLAYQGDEWDVLDEYYSLNRQAAGMDLELLSATEASLQSPVIKKEGLKGALWSKTECTVNPREVLSRFPDWLEQELGLIRRYGETVTHVESGLLITGEEPWNADQIIICSGADFNTLYPKLYREQELIKCKLQMMKGVTDEPLRLGPTLCAGLTLRHYAAFSKCTSLAKLDKRYDEENILYKKHGVHVLLAQHGSDFIIGDSHQYGLSLPPFDEELINQLILSYLETFCAKKFVITERWHGIYPKKTGKTHLVLQPEEGVTVVNGLGGAGMTLSFGLAEQVIHNL